MTETYKIFEKINNIPFNSEPTKYNKHQNNITNNSRKLSFIQLNSLLKIRNITDQKKDKRPESFGITNYPQNHHTNFKFNYDKDIDKITLNLFRITYNIKDYPSQNKIKKNNEIYSINEYDDTRTLKTYNFEENNVINICITLYDHIKLKKNKDGFYIQNNSIENFHYISFDNNGEICWKIANIFKLNTRHDNGKLVHNVEYIYVENEKYPLLKWFNGLDNGYLTTHRLFIYSIMFQELIPVYENIGNIYESLLAKTKLNYLDLYYIIRNILYPLLNNCYSEHLKRYITNYLEKYNKTYTEFYNRENYKEIDKNNNIIDRINIFLNIYELIIKYT